MLELLILIIALCTYFSYKEFRSLFAPPVLYSGGFFFCAMIAQMYSYEWDMDKLHFNTFFVVAFGAIAFTFTSIFFHRRALRKTNQQTYIEMEDKGYEGQNLNIPLWILIGYALAQIAYYYIYARAISSVTGYSNFVDAAHAYDVETKFNEYSTMKLPTYIGLLSLLFSGVIYIFLYFAARSFVSKTESRKRKLIYLVIVLTSIVGPLASGGRAGAVKVLLSIVFFVYFAYKDKSSWKNRLPRKAIVGAAGGALLLALSWGSLAELLGRKMNEKSYGIEYYIAIYCGAQIKNLDIYLNQPSPEHSKIFGEQTFMYFQRSFRKTRYKEQLDLPFISNGKFSLGNVYTCYYMYIYDFGYWGLLLIFPSAYISTLVWNKSRYSKKRNRFVWLLVYGYLIHPISFSFFSNEFYQSVVNVGFFKRVIMICIEFYILRCICNHRMKYQVIGESSDAMQISAQN